MPELRELEKNNPQAALLFRHARVLEGLNRHAGTHAAGVIITPGPSMEYLPSTSRGRTSRASTRWSTSKDWLPEGGLPGLRTLTVIKDAVDMANARGGGVDMDKIRWTTRGLSPHGAGRHHRGFPVESSGMRDYLRKLKRHAIEDLIAMNALYRPWPLGSNMEDDFIERKHGIKAIKYPIPPRTGAP